MEVTLREFVLVSHIHLLGYQVKMYEAHQWPDWTAVLDTSTGIVRVTDNKAALVAYIGPAQWCTVVAAPVAPALAPERAPDPPPPWTPPSEPERDAMGNVAMFRGTQKKPGSKPKKT